MLRTTAIVLLSGAAVLGFVAAANIMDINLYQWLGPKYEATRRDIMLNSRVYQEGELRTLYNYQRQYVQSKDDAEKSVIAAAARHELGTLDKNRLPADLQQFASQIEAQ